MHLSVAAIALGFISAVYAQCERVQDSKLEVVAYPGGDVAAFCTSWKSTCQSYYPSDASLLFNSTSCRAGDLVLQNKDTQASVTCSFSADEGCTKTAFFVEVAELTNATLVGPWTSD